MLNLKYFFSKTLYFINIYYQILNIIYCEKDTLLIIYTISYLKRDIQKISPSFEQKNFKKSNWYILL